MNNEGKTHFADDDTLRYIQSLEQQLAEAQRDAARYRWLRDGGLYKWFDSVSNVSLINLDAAIDQAMREGE